MSNKNKHKNLIKSTVLVPVKAVTKPITGTLVPRAVRNNIDKISDNIEGFRKFSTGKQAKIYCPKCLQSELYYDPMHTHWACPTQDCGFEFVTEDTSHETLKQHVLNCSDKFDPPSGYEEEHLHKLINTRVKSARILMGIAVLMLIFMCFNLFNLSILTIFAYLVIISFTLLNCAMNGYRAWQLATGTVYKRNSKEIFHWYVLNNNWVANPTVGNANYFDDSTVDEIDE